MLQENEPLVLCVGLLSLLLLAWLIGHFKARDESKCGKNKRNDKKINLTKVWIKEMNKKYRKFWVDTLKKPKYMMAPMVLQSELAFRMMCRKYNCKLCWTPMIRASEIIYNYEKYGNLKRSLLFHKFDRPLIIQLCSNKPNEIVKATKIIESFGNIADGIDINLGCPQRCARDEMFGAFLLDKPQIVKKMINELVNNVSMPISAKIRIKNSFESTIEFTNMLIESGISLLTIHGRRRERTHHKGPADLNMIKLIKKYYIDKGLNIPIISNGNIRTTKEAKNALKLTNADGVMSACGILRNPYIFDTKRESYFRYSNGIKMSWEYLRYVEKYGVVDTKSVNDHLLTFCEPFLDGNKNKKNWDIRRLLRQYEKVFTIAQFIAIIELLEVRLKFKQKMTKTECDSIFNMITMIRRNKVKNYRLERMKENSSLKDKKLNISYNKRVNLLFNNDSSESE